MFIVRIPFLCLFALISELIEEYANGKGKTTKKGKEKEKASKQLSTSKSSMYVIVMYLLLHYLTLNKSCIL
jgi:hypothetical protein